MIHAKHGTWHQWIVIAGKENDWPGEAKIELLIAVATDKDLIGRSSERRLEGWQLALPRLRPSFEARPSGAPQMRFADAGFAQIDTAMYAGYRGRGAPSA
jgi:hypothetical protein